MCLKATCIKRSDNCIDLDYIDVDNDITTSGVTTECEILNHTSSNAKEEMDNEMIPRKTGVLLLQYVMKRKRMGNVKRSL